MSRPERLALVDHDDRALAVVTQCRLLKVARSTLYYQPVPVSADDLAVMRRMDELYLTYPFYGSRRMVAVLRREGWAVNRKSWSPETGQVAKRGSPLGAAVRPKVRHDQYSEETHR